MVLVASIGRSCGEEGRREVWDGGEVREAWGRETNFCLFVAMVPFTSHPPHYLCSSRALHLLNSGQHVKPPGPMAETCVTHPSNQKKRIGGVQPQKNISNPVVGADLCDRVSRRTVCKPKEC